jgi:hypothetical protein
VTPRRVRAQDWLLAGGSALWIGLFAPMLCIPNDPDASVESVAAVETRSPGHVHRHVHEELETPHFLFLGEHDCVQPDLPTATHGHGAVAVASTATSISGVDAAGHQHDAHRFVNEAAGPSSHQLAGSPVQPLSPESSLSRRTFAPPKPWNPPRSSLS